MTIARGQFMRRATKLYWPPTPLTTRPSASPSETIAPASVAIIAELMKRASRRCAIFNCQSGPRSSFVKLTGIIRKSARSESGIARSAS